MAGLIETLSDPRIIAAVIGACVVAGGWIVAPALSLRREAQLRKARVRDVLGALYAEIRVYTSSLKSRNLHSYGQEVRSRILSQPGYFPIIPTENNDSLFRAIIADIHILPFRVVDPVVLYYSQLIAINAIIGDLRDLPQEKLEKIGPERAAAMYDDYIRMKLTAIEMGDAAMRMIQAYLSGGNAALQRIAEQQKAAQNARLPEVKSEITAWIQAEKQSNSPASARSSR